jgi:hypothetical protein
VRLLREPGRGHPDQPRAEAATPAADAANDWHNTDVAIIKDAAIVPLESQSVPLLSGKRVCGVLPNGQSCPTAIFAPNAGDPDITNVCLAT